MTLEQFEQYYIPEPNTGCWLWLKRRLPKGYGLIQEWAAGYYRNRKNTYAHRWIWQRTYGVIPNGLFVLHRCDTPQCVNPYHLFLGTQTDNMRDCHEKMRHAFGEKHGMAKLDRSTVGSIRNEYSEGKLSQRKIAKKYGISPAMMCFIVNGKRWNQ